MYNFVSSKSYFAAPMGGSLALGPYIQRGSAPPPPKLINGSPQQSFTLCVQVGAHGPHGLHSVADIPKEQNGGRPAQQRRCIHTIGMSG